MSNTEETIQDPCAMEGETLVTSKPRTGADDIKMVIRKSVIQKWARDNEISLAGDIITNINDYIMSSEWDHIVTFGAPTQTPDIGFILSKTKQFAVEKHNFPSTKQVIETLCRNLSFNVWAALFACKSVIESRKMKRMMWDFLEPILNSVFKSALAAKGCIPSTGEPPESKKRKARPDENGESETVETEKAEQLHKSTLKEKKSKAKTAPKGAIVHMVGGEDGADE